MTELSFADIKLIEFADEKEIDVYEFLFNGNIVFVDEPGSGAMTIKSNDD